MRTLGIQGETKAYDIVLGEAVANLPKYLPADVEKDSIVIITDRNVCDHHGGSFKDHAIIEIGTGEGIKTLETVNQIYESFLALELDRYAYVVGIGGGIVCDIAGFAASTFLRGIRFGFVPTTLLAQVDASVGGKNGVNFKGYKNIIGLFNQPDLVLCDFSVLKTLPVREIRCGFAEVIKHGAIADAKHFASLEEHSEAAQALDPTVLEQIVYDSLLVKARIVEADERERGERRKLNFGHTFGHAIEKASASASASTSASASSSASSSEGTEELHHGEAVSIGMVVAANLSVGRGLLAEKERARLEQLLKKFGLPTRITMDRRIITDAIRKDKKRQGQFMNFVLLDRIGDAKIEKIAIEELEAVVYDLCESS